MKNSSKIVIILFLLVLPVIALLAITQFTSSNYLIISLYRIIFLSPIIYRMIVKRDSLRRAITENFSFKIFKKNLSKTLAISLLLMLIFFGAYLVFKNVITLDKILQNIKIANASNIIFIGIFIILINSILEEFFWRGFIFKELSSSTNIWLAYLVSGIAFSFHHIIFYYNWFTPFFFVLITVGLIAFATIMNFIFQKYKDLFSCWLIHAAGNVVQIYLALLIFGLI